MKAKRVMFVAQGQVSIEETEIAAPGQGQVLIEAISSVISPGTELAYLNQLENARWPLPGFNNGYCLCGTVLAVGEGVESLPVGQRVVTPHGHASAAVVEAANCYPVPESLPADQAATFMLGTISLQAIRKARVRLGQSVAVVGLGPIGNYAGQLARAAGATLVVGIDPVAWRQEVALQSGFDAVENSATEFPFDKYHQVKGPQGFDVVIEATGAPDPIVSAFQLARKMGYVALLGSTRGLTGQVDFYNDVHRKGLTVVGAHNGVRPVTDDIDTLFTMASDIRTTIDLLSAGRISGVPLISASVPAIEAPQAYARLSARNEPLLTVALQWA